VVERAKKHIHAVKGGGKKLEHLLKDKYPIGKKKDTFETLKEKSAVGTTLCTGT